MLGAPLNDRGRGFMQYIDIEQARRQAQTTRWVDHMRCVSGQYDSAHICLKRLCSATSSAAEKIQPSSTS